ncbi:MAG: hypothetical protein ABUR63_04520 [Verrucomicrobiota bacterium]
MKMRTLLLLGFTAGAAGLLSGCIIETTSGGSNGGGTACADARYFNVQWGVDHGAGTVPLSCSDLSAMASSLELRTNAAPPYDILPAQYFLSCVDGRMCSDGSPCNAQASTNSAVPTGTLVETAALVGAGGTEFSSAPGPGSAYRMPSCKAVDLSFIFTIN